MRSGSPEREDGHTLHLSTPKKLRKAIFEGKGDAENMPKVELEKATTDNGVTLAEVVVLSGLANSKGEARRLIAQNGIKVNGETQTAFDKVYKTQDFEDFVISKGKKLFKKVIVK